MYARKLIVLSHLDLMLPVARGFNKINDCHDDMINSLMKVPFDETFCIILITDFWQKNKNLLNAIPTNISAHVNNEDKRETRYFDTVIFKITGQQKPGENISFLRSFGSLNLGNYDTLSLMLAFVDENFKSAETVLLTWDHGFGFGIFNNQPNKESAVDSNTLFHRRGVLFESLSMSLNTSVLPLESGSLESVTGSETTPDKPYFELSELDRTDMLTSNELAIAIQRAFNGKKLDLLIFMNCNMMLIDELYTLSGRVKYIVGAESPISWIGYNYKKLVRNLSRKVPKDQLISAITSIFNDFAEKYKKAKQSDLKWQVLSSFNLENMDKTLVIFNNLIILLIKYIRDVYPVLKTYLSDGNDLEGPFHNRDVSDLILKGAGGKEEFYELCFYDCVDLFNYIKADIQSNPSPLKQTNIIGLIDQFSQLITTSREGIFSGFIDENKHNLIREFSGVSVFFPKDLRTLKESSFYDFFYNATGVFTSILSQQSFWNEFVLLFAKYDDLLSANKIS